MALSRQPQQDLPWAVPYEEVLFLANEEDCRLRAYKCPADRWTCGWGETVGVGPNTVWTPEEADKRFCDSVKEYVTAIQGMCKVEPTQHELGAMLSLAYNIGLERFRQSTVLRAHNAGDTLSASRAFGLWNKITQNGQKVVHNGLTARRARESAHYLLGYETAPAPQEVVPERSIARGGIASGAVAMGGTGILAMVSDGVGQLRSIADGLHIQPLTLVAGIAIGAAGLILYNRWKQRKEGWA